MLCRRVVRREQTSVLSWRSGWLSELLRSLLLFFIYLAFAVVIRPRAFKDFDRVRAVRLAPCRLRSPHSLLDGATV
jgi:hypothetical protein